MPPSNRLRPICVTNKKVATLNTSRILPNKFIQSDQNIDACKTYAIILGGCNKNSKIEVAFWNDCSYIYQTLEYTYGIPKDHIIPLISDGNDPGYDMIDSYNNLINQPLDLDNDGVDEIHLACTRNNIKHALSEVSKKIQNGDHLFMFFIGHGGGSSKNYSSFLINKEIDKSDVLNYLDFQDFELPRFIKTYLKNKDIYLNFVMGQCYSGGFIDDLITENIQNFVIATAAESNRPSFYLSDTGHTEFLYYWISAINEAYENGASVDSDINQDGRITMKEAFEYVNTKKSNLLTPVFYSSDDKLGKILSFNYVPVEYDLRIKNSFDDGMLNRFWNSQSINIAREGVISSEKENFFFSSDTEGYKISVQINNNSTKDFDGRFKWCHLYWSKASTVVDKAVWEGEEQYKNEPTGGYITTVKIPAIAAMDSAVIECEINASNLGNYIVNSSEKDKHYLSLLARIDDFKNALEDNDARDFDPIQNPGTAYKNQIVITPEDGDSKFNFFIRNNSTETAKFDFELTPRTPADTTLFSKAQVRLYLSTIRLQPSTGSDMTIKPGFWEVGDTCIKISLDPLCLNKTILSNIKIEPETIDKISISVKYIYPVISIGKPFTFDIVQKSKSGEIVGGTTVLVKRPAMSLRPIEIDSLFHPLGTIQLSIDGDEYSNISWMDSDNRIIGEDQTVSIKSEHKDRLFKVSAINSANEFSSGEILIEKSPVMMSTTSLLNVDDSIDIEFYEETSGETWIYVNSIIDGTNVIAQKLDSQVKAVEVNTSGLSSGNYVLIYMSNGQSLDSMKFTKK